MSRDVIVDESGVWNWEKGRADVDTKPQLSEVQPDQIEEDSGEESEKEVAVRGTKTLADVYDMCNLAQMEPTSYLEAAQSESWRSAMKEELAMIEKNQTWKLVDRPENKKVI